MKVSFVVIAYNAGDKLSNLLKDIEMQDYIHKEVEIILVDSNSTDNTKEIMLNFKNKLNDFKKVLVLDNPKKVLPSGWNIALKASKGNIIIRVDAHSSIPNNFITKNIKRIEEGEMIVGGHRISICHKEDSWQNTLLIAEKSIFGSGIARYRREEAESYVNTLAHAAYRREVFKTIGGYDERLYRTEDNDIHYRMKKAGYRFLLDPTIISYHHVRCSLRKIIKQKFLNGYWIGLTLGVQPKCFSVYHFIPLLFVIAIISFIIIGIIKSYVPLIILIGIYSLFIIINTIFSIRSEKKHWSLVLLPDIFFLLHIAYGFGTLYGLIKLPLWLKKNRKFIYPKIV